MSLHYFSPAPRADHRVREIAVTLRGREFRFMTDRGVFAARGIDRGTRLLLQTMEVEPRDVVLDLGCGYGVIGLVAAALAQEGHAHLVDVNVRATDLARDNAVRNGLVNVTVHLADATQRLPALTCDLALTNPPIRAGRAVVLDFFAAAREALRPGGRFLFVARTGQGARTLARHAADVFGGIAEIARGGGFRVYAAAKDGRAAKQRGAEETTGV